MLGDATLLRRPPPPVPGVIIGVLVSVVSPTSTLSADSVAGSSSLVAAVGDSAGKSSRLAVVPLGELLD